MPCCKAVKGGCCASVVAMCVLLGVVVGGPVLLLLLGSVVLWHVWVGGSWAGFWRLLVLVLWRCWWWLVALSVVVVAVVVAAWSLRVVFVVLASAVRVSARRLSPLGSPAPSVLGAVLLLLVRGLVAAAAALCSGVVVRPPCVVVNVVVAVVVLVVLAGLSAGSRGRMWLWEARVNRSL